MIPDFYTHREEWPALIEQIVELLGRVSALEALSERGLELRRMNRIGSVHSSTAIEGNALSLAAVGRIASGGAVFGPQRDIQEVENAFAAYDALETLDPWNVDDFVRAHGLLTRGLISEAGAFRTVDVDVVGPAGDVLHTGSRHEKVPRLVSELLEWVASADDHPIIVSSAVHFLIEHIHPFRDGNGRIGRLWQTLILSRWRPLFAWTPTETLVRRSQEGYYSALQRSRVPEIDAASFISYMIDIILRSLHEYELQSISSVTDGGRNGGRNAAVLAVLLGDPTLTAVELADVLGTSSRTIDRTLQSLKASGLLRREGSTKSGRWIVVERGS
ncbi:Fic family protein [Microbacterium sp.]|uniref:Fic family protein n=1 Tax=Microbacterium sp. TaxID=51671 RepID=UPI0039E491ED